MTIGIYMITNKINNKKYIGQSVNIKARKHYHFTRHCNKMIISNAIFKHGKENFDFQILEECEESHLDELEVKYIKEYETHISLGKGYNVDLGGKGCGKMSNETKQKLRELNLGERNAFYGKKHTEESLEKMREKQSGKKISEETKQKIKESTTGDKNHFYGKTHTNEVKNLISKLSSGKNNSFYGKKHTEETLQKMRDSNKKLNLGVPMKDETKIKISNSTKGKIISEETKQKMSDGLKGKNLGNGRWELYSLNKNKYRTNFNNKTKSITINKYKDLSKPVIICERICMENEIHFKPNLMKEMENFDLKTIINID